MTPVGVPHNLKSMSPKWSSLPMISVSIWWRSIFLPAASNSVTSPMLIPATGALMGTPASRRARVPPQTEAMEVEPLDSIISEEIRTA